MRTRTPRGCEIAPGCLWLRRKTRNPTERYNGAQVRCQRTRNGKGDWRRRAVFPRSRSAVLLGILASRLRRRITATRLGTAVGADRVQSVSRDEPGLRLRSLLIRTLPKRPVCLPALPARESDCARAAGGWRRQAQSRKNPSLPQTIVGAHQAVKASTEAIAARTRKG